MNLKRPAIVYFFYPIYIMSLLWIRA